MACMGMVMGMGMGMMSAWRGLEPVSEQRVLRVYARACNRGLGAYNLRVEDCERGAGEGEGRLCRVLRGEITT